MIASIDYTCVLKKKAGKIISFGMAQKSNKLIVP